MTNISYPQYGHRRWKAPVDTLTSLPTVGNRDGDARIAIDTGKLYVWQGSSWQTTTVTALTDLSDIAVSAPSIGQKLTWNGTDWQNLNEAQVVTVGASGCNYTTITAALAAITDAAANKRYTIRVAPGTYSGALTLKDYVNIEGVSAGTVFVTHTSTVITGTSVAGPVFLRNIIVTVTPTTDSQYALDVSGDIGCFDCFFANNATTDVLQTAVRIDCTNSCAMAVCDIQLNNTFATTKNHTGLELLGAGSWYGTTINFRNSLNALSGTVCLRKESGTGTRILTSSNVDTTMTNASFVGDLRPLCVTTAAAAGAARADQNVSYRMVQSGTSGTMSGFNVNSGGGAASYQHVGGSLFVSGFATRNVTTTALGDSQQVWLQSTNVSLSKAGTGLAIATPYDDEKSGFIAWGDGTTYWSYVAGSKTLTVDRRVIGIARGAAIIAASGQSVVLTEDVANYIYVNGNGVLATTSTLTEALYLDNIVLLEAWVQGTDSIIVAENHAYKFDSAVSREWHNVFGSLIYGSGATITRVATGTGGAAGDRQIKIVGAASLSDHGLTTAIPDSAGAAVTWEVMYTNASGAWRKYGSYTELPSVYNNAGTVASLGGDRGNYRLYVSKNSINSATPTYIAVIGSATYANQTAADTAIAADNVASATGPLAELELAQLGFITVFDSGGGYITKATPLKQQFGASFIGTAAASTASLITTTTTNFNKVLSSADTTVQAALETLDECLGTGVDNRLARYDSTNKMQPAAALLVSDTDDLSAVGGIAFNTAATGKAARSIWGDATKLNFQAGSAGFTFRNAADSADIASATDAGAWTLPVSATIGSTAASNHPLSVIAATDKSASISFTQNSTAKAYIGVTGSGSDSFLAVATSGDLVIRSEANNIFFAGGSTSYGSCIAGAWTLGASGGTALHILNTAALTTSTAANVSYLRVTINGATRRIATYDDA